MEHCRRTVYLSFCCHFLCSSSAAPLSIYPSVPCSSEVGISSTEHRAPSPLGTGTKLPSVAQLDAVPHINFRVDWYPTKYNALGHDFWDHKGASGWDPQRVVARHLPPPLPTSDRRGGEHQYVTAIVAVIDGQSLDGSSYSFTKVHSFQVYEVSGTAIHAQQNSKSKTPNPGHDSQPSS